MGTCLTASTVGPSVRPKCAAWELWAVVSWDAGRRREIEMGHGTIGQDLEAELAVGVVRVAVVVFTETRPQCHQHPPRRPLQICNGSVIVRVEKRHAPVGLGTWCGSADGKGAVSA